MKPLKTSLLRTLLSLPIAALAGYVTALYQFDLYDASVLEDAIAQLGSKELLLLISVVQVLGYTAFCGFFGHLLSARLGLLRPLRFEKTFLLRTIAASVGAGLVFSLDYWTFGAAIDGIQQATLSGMTLYGWIASVLYGGIIEEVMLRLFVMSLIAWLLWKLLLHRQEIIPQKALIAANIIAAILFAAGHLPATIMAFGTLTPLLLFRCFLLNGGFGLLFGRLFRKYGIQYAMLSHATVHIISKLIWTLLI